MSSKFSYMDSINQYFQKMRERIQVLELENSNLKKLQNGEVEQLKKEFSSLSERHKELKEAFLESENQVKELTREKEEILQKEKEFSELVKNEFENKTNEQVFQTPKKIPFNVENESQKMKYLKAKKLPKKLELKSMYESESDSDGSNENQVKFSDFITKLENFQYKPDEDTLGRDDEVQDESVNVMKQLIGNDLWNCMESSINNEQHHKSSQTKPNEDKELMLLTNMFGAFLEKLNSQDKTNAYLAKLDPKKEASNFLRRQVGGTKK
jgi:hypothetical protein